MFVCDEDVLKVNQYLYDNREKFNIEIGEKIKECRKRNNIIMKKFSERSLMGINQINQIERGKNGISLNKFVIICNALEINPNVFLEDFLYTPKIYDDSLYYSLQGDKDLIKNVIDFVVSKK